MKVNEETKKAIYTSLKTKLGFFAALGWPPNEEFVVKDLAEYMYSILELAPEVREEFYEDSERPK